MGWAELRLLCGGRTDEVVADSLTTSETLKAGSALNPEAVYASEAVSALVAVSAVKTTSGWAGAFRRRPRRHP